MSEVSLVCRAPQLLTIHLKRFRQDARGRLVKVSGHIAFDLDLDMTSFCNPQACLTQRSLAAAQGPSPDGPVLQTAYSCSSCTHGWLCLEHRCLSAAPEKVHSLRMTKMKIFTRNASCEFAGPGCIGSEVHVGGSGGACRAAAGIWPLLGLCAARPAHPHISRWKHASCTAKRELACNWPATQWHV